MTSGEWDLRALKALEEEEQKEFLALRNSQKNLFEAAAAATTATSAASKNVDNGRPAFAYAQLHPHLLKLPTIDECRRQAKAASSSSAACSPRLQLSRALSLSAHSLAPRASEDNTLVAGFGRKLKARFGGASAKSSGSLSPGRNSFRTLQQPERKKRQGNAHSLTPPQLQRILGTNKTFWKYGANSTAASIVGQRARLQQQQQRGEVECKMDELHAEAQSDAFDSGTETGSCSVPLPAADSNELLRLSLMLNSASSAITLNAGATATAATGGPGPGRRYELPSDVEDEEFNGEAVAYEAFQWPHSFEHTLFKGGGNITLTAQERNSRVLFKSNSLDAAAGVGGAVSSEHPQQQIIGQPLAMTMTAATNQLGEHQTNEARYQPRHRPVADCNWEAAAAAGAGVGVVGGGERAQVKYHQDLSAACYGHNAMLCGALIDDELEQHIKHCSCSCNHMGYGNSMDYQVSVAQSTY